jgi:hypothetical protein
MDGMKRSDLLAQIALGEDSTRQFKVDVKNADSLASEMAAFANTNGGTIFIGVADDGSTPGLSGQDVARINQLISNGASQLVCSPLAVQTENVALENGRIVIALTVPKGIDKPYFDKNGVIWLKAGADKRQVNSRGAAPPFSVHQPVPCRRVAHKSRDRKAGQAAFPGFSAGCLQTGLSRFPRRANSIAAKHEPGHRRRQAEPGRGVAVCRAAGMDRAAIRGQGDPLPRQQNPCHRLPRHRGFFRTVAEAF